jgi:hypothetical protein
MQTISKMKMGEDVKDEVAEMEVLDSNDEDETGKDKVGPDVKRRKLLSKSESGCIPRCMSPRAAKVNPRANNFVC